MEWREMYALVDPDALPEFAVGFAAEVGPQTRLYFCRRPEITRNSVRSFAGEHRQPAFTGGHHFSPSTHLPLKAPEILNPVQRARQEETMSLCFEIGRASC